MAVLMALSLLAVPLTELIAGATGADEPEPAETSPTAPTGGSPAYDAPFPADLDPDARYEAHLVTNLGVIVIELDPAGAPLAASNLVHLADDGYFEGITFHRVIEGFVIQAGDPTGTGAGGPGYTFADELGTAGELVAAHGGYPRGTVAMANAGPDTNGSQFFIVHGQVVPLEPLYTVFGHVTEGIDVVDAIATVDTDAVDRPFEDVTLQEVRVERRSP